MRKPRDMYEDRCHIRDMESDLARCIRIADSTGATAYRDAASRIAGQVKAAKRYFQRKHGTAYEPFTTGA